MAASMAVAITGLEQLPKLYLPLAGWVGLGIVLGRKLPQSIAFYLGKFLFWVGVPLGITAFLRQADLSASVWMAPIACWLATLGGAGFALLWIKVQAVLAALYLQNPELTDRSRWHRLLSPFLLPPLQEHRPTQGSFLQATMFGNTGYLGYPIVLALVGPQYFGWAVFYDTLGSTLGAYGLGVVMAAHFGVDSSRKAVRQPKQLLQALVYNPALWSFGLGLAGRTIALPEAIEHGLKMGGWTVIALSLLLLGMRLSQLSSWRNIQQASLSLCIKMLLVPLMVGVLLPFLGITGLPQLVLVLQMAMPPAFATLVIAEAYDLDRDLTVTTLALGAIVLLLLLPVWLWLFPLATPH